VERVRELSGFDEASKRLDEKLRRWKTEDRKDYFLEEILKLPYLQGMK
jgi:hypothetical protein